MEVTNSPKITEIRRAAMNMLARREHTYGELLKKLRHKIENVPVPLIEEVLQQLVSENLLSDERFTESFVVFRCNRGYGPNKIITELQQRQVSDSLIEQYVDPHAVEWQERIRQVWQKRFGQMPEDYNEQAKQMRYLQYRGFSTEQIKSLFADLKNE